MPKAIRLEFADIGGWNELDHVASFSCFLKSAEHLRDSLPKPTALGANPVDLQKVAFDALQLAKHNRNANGALSLSAKQAKNFFEAQFSPFRFDVRSYNGFVTGYYEPEIKASRHKHGGYQYPIYRKPDDLVKIDDSTRPHGLDPYFKFARETENGLVEYFDREAIQNGILAGKGYEIYWLQDPVDVFFIHIQGSARLELDDGSHARISYAAKSGHPYTPIGRILVERGDVSKEDISMDSIRQWLKDNPDKLYDLLKENRSYIFFQDSGEQSINNTGPIAAAGVPLTAGYSLAVDKSLHTFATPVFIRTTEPLPWEQKPFSRLMIAQDTGSAIVGAERGDLFIGSGDEAGKLAGWIKHKADFVFLLPKKA